MKRINIFSLALLLCVCLATAQTTDVRTVKTIVADVLAQMPVQNQDSYNKLFQDLAATGEEGLTMLIDLFNTPQPQGNVPVEYALSGLAAYVSAPDQEAARTTVSHAFRQGADQASTPEIKNFFLNQLWVMNGGKNEAYTPATSGTATYQLQAGETGQAAARISALGAEFGEEKKSPSKLLLSALKDSDREYRNAALNFASSYADASMYIDVMKAMRKAKPEPKVDMLNWLGREAASSASQKTILKDLEIKFELPARQVLIDQLKDPSFEVKQAAAWALTRIGDKTVIPTLANLLTNPDKQVVLLGQETLSSFPGDIDQAVAKIIPRAPDAGKVAALQLLALRKADANSLTVYNQLESTSPTVKEAAYTALKDVVGERDFVRLCGLLETTSKEADIKPLQQAIVASLGSMDPAAQVSTVTKRMLQAGEAKKSLYYPVLASTGNPDALTAILNGFKTGRGAAKEQAFEALLQWNKPEAADELYIICQDPSTSTYFDRALEVYIRLSSSPEMSKENRLIRLRKAMEIARTDAQKNEILKQIQPSDTYTALVYAGGFLDQKPIQEAAAQAVMNIALGHKEYTGKIVRDLLAKTSAVLNNPDAGYQREAIRKHLEEMPQEEGFVSIFNGKDLAGWKGLVGNPLTRAKMNASQLATAQRKADAQMRLDWKAENGCLVFDGQGYDNLCTDKQYGDFEMYIDWMLDANGTEGDAGIYLRGTPQVQIWDTSRTNVGAQVGSGGLYNNKLNPSKPLKVADNKLGEWNTFYIRMVGDRVTVLLNGEKVTDEVILENYWDDKRPIFPIEQLELQAHGSKVYYRDIYVKELARQEAFQPSAEEKKEGYQILFDGTNMYEWTGNTVDYTLSDGTISLVPSRGSGGNLYTKKEYGNFVFRFEFQLTPAANNGLGIRTPMEGDAAYVGMELQILDSEHPVYKDLEAYQYHGSVYGIIPAQRGYLKPVGEWNYQEVIADGDHIRITLNGHVILDGNIREATKNGTADKQDHPGLFNKKGHIGFLGHGSPVKFRNIRIKEIIQKR